MIAKREMAMRNKPWASLVFCATLASAFHADLGETQAQDVEIPSGPEITAISGVPTVIYGQRNKCTKHVAPSYEAVLERNAVTRPPEHGALSGGGEGERYSRSCKRRVPVRAIMYTSDPGFAGTDVVVFWGKETVIINVVPE